MSQEQPMFDFISASVNLSHANQPANTRHHKDLAHSAWQMFESSPQTAYTQQHTHTCRRARKRKKTTFDPYVGGTVALLCWRCHFAVLPQKSVQWHHRNLMTKEFCGSGRGLVQAPSTGHERLWWWWVWRCESHLGRELIFINRHLHTTPGTRF